MWTGPGSNPGVWAPSASATTSSEDSTHGCKAIHTDLCVQQVRIRSDYNSIKAESTVSFVSSRYRLASQPGSQDC